LLRKLGTLMIGGVSFMPQMIPRILVYALARRLLAHSSLAEPGEFLIKSGTFIIFLILFDLCVA
jgi:hypothetical protein